jgi:hypothetical protein
MKMVDEDKADWQRKVDREERILLGVSLEL